LIRIDCYEKIDGTHERKRIDRTRVDLSSYSIWVSSQNESVDCYTDEQLLTRIRGGEHSLFGPLVRRYERELYGYLSRYTGDSELAADVFQNTCLAVFTKIQQYEPGRAARPWLYTVATNQAIDAMRRRARRKDAWNVSLLPMDETTGDSSGSLFELLEHSAPSPEDLAEVAEMRQLVRVSVDELPDLLRQVVVLTYFQGLKYQDAAEILGIPLGTVKSRLHAALAKLTESWTGSKHEDEAYASELSDMVAKPVVRTKSGGRP
jgi:RNA polymerase sigma-70 factor, ECF subfamily